MKATTGSPRPRFSVAAMSQIGSLLLAGLIAGPAAAVVRSTGAGGPWDDPATWIGGNPPTAADDVILSGPVWIAMSAACASLVVETTGQLTNWTGSPSTLSVGGNIQNQGSLLSSSLQLTMRVGGDLDNEGTWAVAQTVVTGNADRHLATSELSSFSSKLSYDPAASGDLIVDTPFVALADIALGTGRMILQPDCPLTLEHAAFRDGTLLAEGNEIRFLSYGYLASCTVDRGVLVGQAYTAGGIDFTNGVVVMDHLENVNSSPSNTLNVDGLLDNRGTICNGSYGVIVNLSGDLRNEGDICCSMVALDFGEHHVTMGPDGDCGALVFLPEFQGGTIYVDSDARFTRGVGLGGGQMVLAPGVTVEFSMHSGVTTGTVIGNGGTLVLLDYAAVSALTIDSAVLSGKFDVSNEIQLTGNVRATGILENREFLPASISIDGTFRNEGTIRDNNAALSIVASGDLENAGTWTNSSVVLSGTQDQRVGIGPGIDVPSFVLDSGLLGASYQWLKNGSPIAGANGSTLSFAGLGAADYGTYRCQVDGGSLSRTFELEEGTDPASAPGSGPQGSAALSRVFPNPFTRSTTIGFELAETSPVHLSIHDVTGREIEVLVDGLMTQGPHEVVWSPIADDSGVFYYRLVTAGDVRTGRCLRLGTGRSSR